jgi:4-amino-4-deoxy-L-arabinose transferase-like glycosyltransferase
VAAPARNRISVRCLLVRFAVENYAACVSLILALTFINSFWHLATNVVSDLDEARYGVAASEMLHRHTLLVATYGGTPEYWNLKPPLGYWMQELAFRVFGPSVFAMRLPAALSALGVVALTMYICRRWFGRRPALLAGTIMATCFGFFSYHGARSGDLDSPLTLILMVAVIQIPTLVNSAGSRLLCAAMFALGFLLKSFAILPFIMVTLAHLAWSGEWRNSRWRDWWLPLLLLIGVIFGWAYARSRIDGSMYFVNRMVREDLLWRSTQVIDNETSRPYGYLLVLLDRFAPWPVIVGCTAFVGKRAAALCSAESRLLWLWVLVPLVMFSLARTQHHWYLDPTYPGWAMLAALALVQAFALSTAHARTSLVILVCLGLLFGEARVLLRIGRTDRITANQAFLTSLSNHALLPENTLIEAQFQLSHSERFILQVVDNYRVTEAGSPQLANSLLLPNETPRVLLFRKSQARLAMGSLASAFAARPLIETSDYLLWQIGKVRGR